MTKLVTLKGYVAESAYAIDLKSIAARFVGSSPTIPTMKYTPEEIFSVISDVKGIRIEDGKVEMEIYGYYYSKEDFARHSFTRGLFLLVEKMLEEEV